MVKWAGWLEMTWQLESDLDKNLIDDFNAHTIIVLRGYNMSSFIRQVITDINLVKKYFR